MTSSCVIGLPLTCACVSFEIRSSPGCARRSAIFCRRVGEDLLDRLVHVLAASRGGPCRRPRRASFVAVAGRHVDDRHEDLDRQMLRKVRDEIATPARLEFLDQLDGQRPRLRLECARRPSAKTRGSAGTGTWCGQADRERSDTSEPAARAPRHRQRVIREMLVSPRTPCECPHRGSGTQCPPLRGVQKTSGTSGSCSALDGAVEVLVPSPRRCRRRSRTPRFAGTCAGMGELGRGRCWRHDAPCIRLIECCSVI